MTDVNHVILIGRVTRDVIGDERSFGYVGNGTARANVSIAVNRSKKSGDKWEEETSFFDVTIWGAQAESLKNYLTKGKMIAVDGYLKQDRWDGKDGQKMSKVSIVANNVQLLSGPSGSGSGTSNNNSNNGYSNNNYGGYNEFGNNGFVNNTESNQATGGASAFQPSNNPGFGSSSGSYGSSYGSPDSSFPEDIPF